MNELNSLFRKRIGISEDEVIKFNKLNRILEKTALNIPFENFCIIENRTSEITKESLINKLLVKNEGGLCYELNALLYLFLIENGFNACLARGVVYDNVKQKYPSFDRTHLTILLNHNNQNYLIDTGFGANLPLMPVPLTGEQVTSKNGDFKIKNEITEYGDFVLFLKLKHKELNWRIGFAFDSQNSITDLLGCNEIQTIIAEHQESPFNKNALINKLTNEGSVTLTNTTFTQWINGEMTKEAIDAGRFKELKREHFGME